LPFDQAEDAAMDSLEGVVLSDGAAFTDGLAQIFIVAQLLSMLLVAVLLGSACHAYLCGTVQRRRAFRCPLMQREVEVEFLERWILGARRSTTPVRCSAFETDTALGCQRRCADRSFRTQWVSALPVASGGNAGGGTRRFEAAS
jgi:hypothetical protein